MLLNWNLAACVRAYALCRAFLGSYSPLTEFLLISRDTDDGCLPRELAVSSWVYVRLSKRNISSLSQSENLEKFFCCHTFHHILMQYKTEIQKQNQKPSSTAKLTTGFGLQRGRFLNGGRRLTLLEPELPQ